MVQICSIYLLVYTLMIATLSHILLVYTLLLCIFDIIVHIIVH